MRVGWSRERKVGSLSYCAREVEAARERWERALGAGGDGVAETQTALAGFAADLERASGLGPRSRAVADEIARELRACGPGAGLARLTALLVGERGAARRGDRRGRGARTALRARGRGGRGPRPWRARMPARVVEQIRQESLARRILEAHGLPRLSLFHLEAGRGLVSDGAGRRPSPRTSRRARDREGRLSRARARASRRSRRLRAARPRGRPRARAGERGPRGLGGGRARRGARGRPGAPRGAVPRRVSVRWLRLPGARPGRAAAPEGVGAARVAGPRRGAARGRDRGPSVARAGLADARLAALRGVAAARCGSGCGRRARGGSSTSRTASSCRRA